MQNTNNAFIVLPGDPLPIANTKLNLGPGLTQNEDRVIAVKGGILRRSHAGNKYWVDNNQRRYVPATGDPVLGVIVHKGSEYYRVDIGSAHNATLSLDAFENATKRNRPNLAVGTLVYAYVKFANKDMEPELMCVNEKGKAAGYGELKNGYVFKCSLGLTRRLLDNESQILKLLEEVCFKLEIAIGLNGRVWVLAESMQNTIIAVNAIQKSEYLDGDGCRMLVNALVNEKY